jgi:hypothetical protein
MPHFLLACSSHVVRSLMLKLPVAKRIKMQQRERHTPLKPKQNSCGNVFRIHLRFRRGDLSSASLLDELGPWSSNYHSDSRIHGYTLRQSNMAGWEIPELNSANGKITYKWEVFQQATFEYQRYSTMTTCTFPKMGVPRNHPFQ